MKKTAIFTLLVFAVFSNLNAQEQPNPITTAAPFLLIAPDARAGGMGDIGVATSADAFSQHWNASKYAFMPSQFSVGVFYTPWLKELTNDVFLGGFNYRNMGGASTFYYANKECAFSSVGNGLTDTESANLYTAVQAFQTTLSRNV